MVDFSDEDCYVDSSQSYDMFLDYVLDHKSSTFSNHFVSGESTDTLEPQVQSNSTFENNNINIKNHDLEETPKENLKLNVKDSKSCNNSFISFDASKFEFFPSEGNRKYNGSCNIHDELWVEPLSKRAKVTSTDELVDTGINFNSSLMNGNEENGSNENPIINEVDKWRGLQNNVQNSVKTPKMASVDNTLENKTSIGETRFAKNKTLFESYSLEWQLEVSNKKCVSSSLFIDYPSFVPKSTSLLLLDSDNSELYPNDIFIYADSFNWYNSDFREAEEVYEIKSMGFWNNNHESKNSKLDTEDFLFAIELDNQVDACAPRAIAHNNFSTEKLENISMTNKNKNNTKDEKEVFIKSDNRQKTPENTTQLNQAKNSTTIPKECIGNSEKQDTAVATNDKVIDLMTIGDKEWDILKNVKGYRLGDRGRALLKSRISKHLRENPQKREMAMKISGVRCATTKQLFQLAKVCELEEYLPFQIN